MIVEGSFTFQGPREVVWDLLLDPAVLVKALPGAKELTRTGEDEFKGSMQVGVGPVTAGQFAVTVALRDKVPPESFAMQVDGKGGIGFARGTARVELAQLEDGSTLMNYKADLQVGGKIAGIGQRLLDSASKTMTRQGLEAVNRELQLRLTGVSAARSPWRPVLWIVGTLLLIATLFVLCAGPPSAEGMTSRMEQHAGMLG